MSNTIKGCVSKYKHALMLIYFLFYMPWFMFLNQFTPTRNNVTYMYCPIDDYIPFLEIFAVPYFIWFLYIAAGYVFLLLVSREEFMRMCIFLYTGMTFCLIVYTLFPNGQQMRVDYNTLGRSNFLIEAIRALQSADSPYNVCPSIHTLNSIGMHISIAKSKHIISHRKLIVWSSFIIAVLIILSTVFVKQHSFLDIFAAIIVAVPLYFLAYKTKLKKV